VVEILLCFSSRGAGKVAGMWGYADLN